MTTRVLGISGLYHDSAAAAVVDGEIVAAAQEERFSRRKHDPSWPASAIAFCLSKVGGRADYVAFYEDPVHTADRVVRSAIRVHPEGRDLWQRAARGLFGGKAEISRHLATIVPEESKRLFVRHHTSHAASTYYPSPFRRAAVLVVDGVGEESTTSVFAADGLTVEPRLQILFPHSVGLLYSALTAYCGFKVNSGEQKLMGLAPFGRPRFVDLIYDRLLRLGEDGAYEVAMEYFTFDRQPAMVGERFASLFPCRARAPEAPLTQGHADLAASLQEVITEVLLRLARTAVRECDCDDLCLAGGVALNCVANGRLERSRVARRVWIQPAAGDSGGALGAALYVSHALLGLPRAEIDATTDRMRGSLLGPSYSSREVGEALSRRGLRFENEPNRSTHHSRVAEALAAGMVVGRFSGRMEFGPRTLGARSLLADARLPQARRRLNLTIKRRESWRPFAPAVLAEHAARWFELEPESPYMLLAGPVLGSQADAEGDAGWQDDLVAALERRTRHSPLPAVTHVDGSARVQTVDRARNPDFHALLTHFFELTGCPVVVNTSFNVRGEPIVCSPDDAIGCFLNTGIDLLAIEDYLVYRAEQSITLQQMVGKTSYDPD